MLCRICLLGKILEHSKRVQVGFLYCVWPDNNHQTRATSCSAGFQTSQQQDHLSKVQTKNPHYLRKVRVMIGWNLHVQVQYRDQWQILALHNHQCCSIVWHIMCHVVRPRCPQSLEDTRYGFNKTQRVTYQCKYAMYLEKQDSPHTRTSYQNAQNMSDQ